MHGAKNLLCGYIGGTEAEIMETIPEDVVLEVCYELLQRFTKRADLPKPTRLLRLL